MFKVIEKVTDKIAIPFNLIGLVVVTVSGWFTYQKTGFWYAVWVPVLVVGFALVIALLSKRNS